MATAKADERMFRGGWRNIGLWAAQLLILLLFGWAGYMKLATPIPELSRMWRWTEDLPVQAVRGLGVIDLMGGIGVVLPWATRIRPGLTVAAALGCAALQCCAIVFHTGRGEASVVWFNALFLALAVLVFVGRRRDLDRGDPRALRS